MSPIQRLAPEVADAIAAGEVIERPASVVKELVENALDAGATRITVDVRGAGRTSIRVSDDGSGIPAGELAVAFLRHATSKVSTLADLDSIATLGFRGEALASIAAVADVECSSDGSRIRVRAGAVIERGSGPVVPGVNLEVRDLFANVPARLKFLKSDATEVAAMKEVVSAYALLHPGVRFQLTVEGRIAVHSSGDGDVRQAASAVLGGNVAAELMVLRGEGAPSIAGMVSQPRLSRGSRDGIVLAVNGRPITSRSLVYALEECYQGRLERGRHPIAVIDVAIEPGFVDVNVHPAKKEVRFRDESGVFSALQRAVRSALGGSEAYRMRTTSPASAPGVAPAARLSLHEPAAVIALPASAGQPGDAAAAGVLRPIGQVAAGYLVAEGPEGLVLVDQHAAHERILYNRLLQRLRRGSRLSQALLMPQAVDVEPALIAAAMDNRDALGAFGLELEEFGPRSLRIVAVPVEMPANRATAAVQETLAALSENRGDDATEKVAAALACHSAVRFGDVLEPAEQRRLLSDLEATEESVTCPHGRPTRLVVEWRDLTRHFRRNY